MIYRLCVCVVALGLLAGCGGPNFVPVEGIVTLDGSPLPFKSLFFAPDSAGLGKGAGGFTDRNGKYYLIAVVHGTTMEYRGVEPGRYRVTVSEPMIPITDADFGPLEREIQGAEAAPAIVISDRTPRPQQPIPAIYTSAATTPLVVEVPETGGALNLELTSKSE